MRLFRDAPVRSSSRAGEEPPNAGLRGLAPATRALAVGALAGAAALGGLPSAPAAVAEAPRPLRFPVEATVRFQNDFGAPRSGGRRHEGNDLMGAKLDRLVAVVDGTVTVARGGGSAGNYLTITDAEGWQYRYMHLNNDSPGTDNGRSPAEWVFAPGIAVGATVVAGQHVGYLGDSGNAESTGPHLHFEVRAPGGRAVNPYPSLVAASRPQALSAVEATVRPEPQAPAAASVAQALAAGPRAGFYVLTGDGAPHEYEGAPNLGAPAFSRNLARSMAVTPDSRGYLVLDAWGGLHKFGTARTGPLGALAGPYWPGQERARAVAVTPSGRGYAVLDADGGVASFGDAPVLPAGLALPKGLARDLAISPSGKGLYVLDAWGGVHASGDAVARPGPYWPGQDVARRLALTPSGRGYAVLDARGGLHTTGDAPPAPGGTAPPGGDWRGVALAPDGSYLVLRSDGLAERRGGPPGASTPEEPHPDPAEAPPPGRAEAFFV